MALDAQVAEHAVKTWEKEIEDWVERYKDNMVARQVAHVRKVDEKVEVDVATKYERTGTGAVVAAKGHIPKGSSFTSTETPYTLYQIIDGFGIHAKDIRQDPKAKNRNVSICMGNLHRKEDLFFINGDAGLNVKGMAATAQANPNGKITASGASGSDVDNKGAWAGETGTDPYDDIIQAIDRLGENFDPFCLLGHRNDLNYLLRKDSQRRTFADDVAGLFGAKEPKDRSWMIYCNQMTRGKVYVGARHPEACELVVAENPHPIIYPMQPGQVYPVEVVEWVRAEFHNAECWVELDVT